MHDSPKKHVPYNSLWFQNPLYMWSCCICNVAYNTKLVCWMHSNNGEMSTVGTLTAGYASLLVTTHILLHCSN